jgi:hypothetical protein
MGESLTWLDPTNRDDQFIASTIEVIRQNPRSRVTIVTRDINLQNKAELARLPFVEPPDPPPQAAQIQPPRRRIAPPEIRILEINPTGGSADKIDFVTQIQNYGEKPARVTIAASVGRELVACRPSTLDLLVNKEPSVVRIGVPRKDFGDLIPALNNETTLYDEDLVVEVRIDDEVVVSQTWHEHVYEISEFERCDIQRRIWKIGQERRAATQRARAFARWNPHGG